MRQNILLRTAPRPNRSDLAQNVNSVEIKKLYLRHSITSDRELIFPESSNESSDLWTLVGLAWIIWTSLRKVTVARGLLCPHREVWDLLGEGRG